MSKWAAIICLVIFLFNSGCTAPQYIWPQSDMDLYEINQRTLDKKILIASRKSDFKNAVVDRIRNAFLEAPVYIKIIGIETLKAEDANQYSAVIIINTCMSLVIDRKVEAFLDRYGDLDSVIVLTTSMGGNIQPDMEGRQIDAVSCASAKEQINSIADEIISKINKMVGQTISAM